MGQSPFAKGSSNVAPPLNRRRSARIEHVAPIVISGRNASGQTFREATETIAVSAHGATFKTHNPIMIGMQLMVENVLDGSAEKAICVRVVEPEAGGGQHVIAVQLLHPRNIWGVKDPPADWQFALGATQPEPALPARLRTEKTQGEGESVAAAPSAPGSAAAVSSAESDQRAAEFAESVLVLLRRQAAGILQQSLKEFEERLRAVEAESLQRISRHSERAVAEAGASLEQLRLQLLEKIGGQAEQAAIFAEQNFRERIAEMFAPHQRQPADAQPEKKTGTG